MCSEVVRWIVSGGDGRHSSEILINHSAVAKKQKHHFGHAAPPQTRQQPEDLVELLSVHTMVNQGLVVGGGGGGGDSV